MIVKFARQILIFILSSLSLFLSLSHMTPLCWFIPLQIQQLGLVVAEAVSLERVDISHVGGRDLVPSTWAITSFFQQYLLIIFFLSRSYFVWGNLVCLCLLPSHPLLGSLKIIACATVSGVFPCFLTIPQYQIFIPFWKHVCTHSQSRDRVRFSACGCLIFPACFVVALRYHHVFVRNHVCLTTWNDF